MPTSLPAQKPAPLELALLFAICLLDFSIITPPAALGGGGGGAGMSSHPPL